MVAGLAAAGVRLKIQSSTRSRAARVVSPNSLPYAAEKSDDFMTRIIDT
jgi:hypothetical protein